jgi:hypothetical protein
MLLAHDFAQNRTGNPTHCPEAVEWRGRFKDGRGRWHQSVDSCDGHADGLVNARKIRPESPMQLQKKAGAPHQPIQRHSVTVT